jgi:Concanavalin A-like lectin/glucanases superfamily
MMKALLFFFSIICLSSCAKFDWHNPYDPECPKELFTPSSPGASMEGNSVKLTWSQQNEDISGFALFRNAEGESISNLTQTQKSTTQYIDANFTPGKKYTYYVVAVAGTNKSDTVKAEITPVIPVTISTGSVTELSVTSAKVEGNVMNTGGGTVTSRGICWSTTPNPTISNNRTTEGTGAGVFTSTLTNLLAGTTYYARAYGENSRGVSYGAQVTFTTLGSPKLTTTAVSNITSTTATSGGSIISDGGSPITAKGVVWSTSPNPIIALATKTDDGTGLGSFTSGLSNLSINTKYYVRAYATNNIGTSYGEELSFTSITPIPTVLESLKQGLVAYYPFNGNANDTSGNGNNGEIIGSSLIADRFGNSNKAYSLNGINNYIVMPNNSLFAAAEMTISYWKKSALVRQDTDLMYGNVAEFSWQTGWSNNNFIGMQIKCNTSNGGSSAVEQLNTNWNNITFVIRGRQLSIYINGVLKHTLDNLVSITCNKADYKLYIGNDIYSGSEFYPFSIDDLRLYNRALTPSEITYLANN